MAMTPERAKAFWSYVKKTDTCWLWTAGKSHGYGRFYIPGRRSLQAAHRVSFEEHFGPIPARLFVIHSCDVPACVNPAHLRAGTHADNMTDAKQRGRMKKALLTECAKGLHPMSADNVRVLPDGRRLCLACRAANLARSHRRDSDRRLALPAQVQVNCVTCGEPTTWVRRNGGRPPKYCSQKCKNSFRNAHRWQGSGPRRF